MRSLRDILEAGEDRLVQQVLGYALEHGYANHAPSREKDWRLAVAGLSRALLEALDAPGGVPEPGMDDVFSEDPAAEFAITEARLHRGRGMTLAMFLGLFSYFRRAFLDLVEQADLPSADKAAGLRAVGLFFERVGIALAVEWRGTKRDRHLAELQAANRDLTNEKNRYLTLFEALDFPVFVLDAQCRIATCNTAAAEWLLLSGLPGSEHCLRASAPAGAAGAEAVRSACIDGVIARPAQEVLPMFDAEIRAFAKEPRPRVSFDKTMPGNGRKTVFKATLLRMLDYGRKFQGVLVLLEDVTARRFAKEAMLRDHARLEGMVRQKIEELEEANTRLRLDARDREMAQEALRQGSELYRAVVEDQTELICRFTPDGVLTFVNQAYCRYFLKKSEELLGRSFFPFLPGDELARYREHLARITPDSPTRVVEHLVLAPDGGTRWQRWMDRGFFDSRGEAVAYQSVGSDITDRKRAELALQELNETLERRVAERTRDAEARAEKIARVNAALEEEVARRQEAETVLRRRFDLEKVLAEATSLFISLLPEGLDAGVEESLGVLGQLLGVDRAYMFRIRDRFMDNTHEWCADGIAAQKDSLQNLPWDIYPWWMEQLWSLENIVLSDLSALPPQAKAEREVLEAQGIQSLLVVPMVRAGQLLGFLGFDSVRTRKDWGPEDITLLETYGRIVAAAQEGKRMEVALRESGRRYRDLVENLSEGILVLDASEVVTYANRSMGKMIGYATEEMIGKSIFELMSEEERKEVRKRLDLRRQGVSERHEHQLTHRNGSKVFAFISGSPILDDQGRYAGSTALITDITREKHMQAQLFQAQKLESIGQLAAGIAHEINTPTQYVSNNMLFLGQSFAGMLGMCDLLGSLLDALRKGEDPGPAAAGIEAEAARLGLDFLKEEIPQAIKESLEGLERIATIVRSVKQFAHPVGQAKQPEDLNAAIRSAITVSTNEWKYVAEMVEDLDPDLPPTPCVLGEINQVALNLITNAAHAIAEARGERPAGKGRITISTRRDGDWVELRVSDTGTGIPAAIRSRIFDPFFTTKPVGQGTGQGLSISHTVVVEKHGGSIGFETEEGRGTAFIVRLPLEENAAP